MSGNEVEINTYYELYTQCKLERDLLKQELQKTREQLDIAEAVLNVQVTDSALAYFKDKQGEG